MAARIVGLAAQARLVTAALSARLVGPRGLLLQGLRAVRGARHGLGDCSHIVRVRTGMACVLCWSFSLVGAGSSARAWPRLVCWLLISIKAGSSAPGAPSPGAAAGFAFACISWSPNQTTVCEPVS